MNEENRIYGYCRISSKKQSLERQIENIKKVYPDAILFTEAFTGTKMNRPKWNQLYKIVRAGDTIVFDSVSRMSRNSEEGVATYFDLLEKGVNLKFLKEAYIDTDLYKENQKNKLELNGSDEDEIFKGLNNYFKLLAIRQIKIAFDQAEKEVMDLRQRTKEGIRIARLNGKQVGLKKGTKLNVKKKEPAKKKILEYSKYFDGMLNDKDCIKVVGINSKTYYKYKRELKEELAQEYSCDTNKNMIF